MFNFSDNFIKDLKNWNKTVFNKFYLQTVDIFFRWVKSMYNLQDDDIQDILSDLYLKLWENKSCFPEDSKWFERWLWFVFKNILKDWFKKKKEIWFSEFENNNWNNTIIDNLQDDDFLDIFEKDYKFEMIKQALEQLPEKYKDIVFLKYVEQKNNDEIAEILGISEDNVRQRLSRAIKKLKQLLNNIL